MNTSDRKCLCKVFFNLEIGADNSNLIITGYNMFYTNP